MSRNVLLLGGAMALGLSGAPVIVLLGGILGVSLAPSPSWSTLPVAVMVVGLAAATVPSALLMRRIGRRRGFVTGALLAAAGSLVGVGAVATESFALFCLAAFFVGVNLAFVQQYRFAAAESVDPREVGRAVSFVLIGGIAAAFLGPELAKRTRDLLPFGLYSGSFAALAGLGLANALLLSFLGEPRATGGDDGVEGERPLGEVVRQPVFLIAAAASLTAFGVMSFIMTATPVSMHVIDRFSIDETTRVIQSHIMAMYLPSLFTGALIARLGLVRVMLSGVALMAACVAVAVLDRHFVHYWGALVLLGVGWNFLFVGGTTLLTRAYRPAERFKAQAVNDFAVFGFQAAASLSAGTVIFTAGWEALNAASLPLLAAMFVAIWRQRSRIDLGEEGGRT